MPTETLAGETAVNDVVSIEIDGGIGLIALNNPPVNAASHAVRSGLWQAVETLRKADGVEVLALYAKGRTFIAGADIREFGKPPADPWLPELCNFIEGSTLPIVCVLHGTTLGGGLEVAMSCHARVALKGTKVGLPEVTLGILPGAGGTQRAPRLAGISYALDMITTGRQVSAEEALEHGLIDRITDGEPRAVALAAAQDLKDGSLSQRRTGDLVATPDAAAIETMRAKLARTQPLLFSPHKCIDAVAACHLPILEGMKEERRLYEECMKSPQRAGLIHAFFSERAVTKIPEASQEPRQISSIGVIGGGTMGSGIATAALLAGLPVTLTERDEAGLGRGVQTITGNLEGAVKRGKLTAARRDEILGGVLAGATDHAALAGADLVIEAVFEDREIKKAVTEQAEAVMKSRAIYASNTSTLPITSLAQASKRPKNFIGIHFFSPVDKMMLVEVILGKRTSDRALAMALDYIKAIKKTPIVVNDSRGFYTSRVVMTYIREGLMMLADGVPAAMIENAGKMAGMPVGPLSLGDEVALDLAWKIVSATRKDLGVKYVEGPLDNILEEMVVKQERFGRKNGKGFYDYKGKDKSLWPGIPEVTGQPKPAESFNIEELKQRLLVMQALETARIFEEKCLTDVREADVGSILGFGFAPYTGGTLSYIDMMGTAAFVDLCKKFTRKWGPRFKPNKLLKEMAKENATFYGKFPPKPEEKVRDAA